MPAGSSPRERLLALGLVGATAALAILPHARLATGHPPDAIEHLAIANAFVHGSGFVDPVQYNFFLEATAPLPASAVRAPIVPALLVLPWWAGAGLASIHWVHALWSVAVLMACQWLLSARMRPWLAAAAIVGLGCSPAFAATAAFPLTEVTALLALVGLLVSSRGVLHGMPGALGCAVATLVAWLTRPNLLVLFPAVIGAVVWHLGARAALRHRPLHVYALAFPLLFMASVAWASSWTGLAPYAGYGVTLQHLRPSDWHDYGVEYGGAWSFAWQHRTEIAATLLERVPQLLRAVCLERPHLGLGWLAAAGVVSALLAGRRIRIEAAFCALSALALTGGVIGNYTVFDPVRFPLQLLAAGVIGAGFGLDERLDRRAQARSEAGTRARRLGLPAVAALALLLVCLRWPALDARPAAAASASPLARLCGQMDPDALVATSRLWSLHEQCGHAVIRLPANLAEPGILERFLAERRPRYLIAAASSLAGHDALRPLAVEGGLALFELRAAASDPPRWQAPPPLVCAGGERPCTAIGGRLRPALP